MQQAPLLVVEEPLVSRVGVIMEDYITDLGAQYGSRCGTEGVVRHRQHLREGLARIKKRLGGALHAEIDQLLCEAFASMQPETAERLHRQWIERLLVKYYDPMYEYQMGKREGQVIARGTRKEIIERAGEVHGL
jgi:tRNA 2-selenouridine synthase